MASFTLSAALPTAFFVLPVALSTLPSALRLSSSVSAPPASFSRPFALSTSPPAMASSLFCGTSGSYPIGEAKQPLYVFLGDAERRFGAHQQRRFLALCSPFLGALVEVVVDPR